MWKIQREEKKKHLKQCTVQNSSFRSKLPSLHVTENKKYRASGLFQLTYEEEIFPRGTEKF